MMSRWRTTLLVVLFLGLLVGLGLAVRQALEYREQIAALARQMDEVRADNQRLRERGEQLAGELETLRSDLGEVTGQNREISSEARQRQSELEAERRRGSAEVAELRNLMASDEATIRRLATRVEELEASARKLGSENRAFEEAQARLREEIAGSRKVVAAMEQQLKDKDRRLANLEAGNQQLRSGQRDAERLNARILELVRQLEETSRRRDVYLNSALRRFRDLTEEFRTAEAAGGSNEIARLQNIVALTEEDLRQLNSLNIRAARLIQEMTKP